MLSTSRNKFENIPRCRIFRQKAGYLEIISK